MRTALEGSWRGHARSLYPGTLGARAPAAPRPAERRRRRVPRARRARATHMHIGGARPLRGRAAGARRAAGRTCARGCTSCRATARSSRRRRSAWAARAGSTTRRFNLDYHVRHTALPAPGDERALRALVGRAVLPAAGPHQAAVGAVAGRGPRATAASRWSPRPTTRSSTASPAPTSLTALFDLDPASRDAAGDPSRWAAAARADAAPSSPPRGRWRDAARLPLRARGAPRARRGSPRAREAPRALGEVAAARLEPGARTRR